MPKKIKKKHDSQQTTSMGPSDEYDEEFAGIIIEYAMPMVEKGKNFVQRRRALNLSIMFWNASFLPEEDQSEAMRKIVADDSVEYNRFTLLQAFMGMIQRKFIEFADVNKVVLKYDVKEAEDGVLLLSVVSKVVTERYIDVFADGNFKLAK
ncbi:MAG: hypothetical protein SFH39_01555 [Candidatus Magnetobacterium sp. LHC-1]|uniref:Uncharacterized protein n=1 Tax=Candidatus Magnetobacterium casense TaxID=1455061 RepID=A0ABS6S1U7_9BACT|nr:hypothetical protein [Candidatus Magnetobacterium casensis]MBF0607799.1 hypothetical protein [Nitrospirota bacterium]MBV6342580.1 hypothetical protein [Candidatus Magnetobacterium casensis]